MLLVMQMGLMPWCWASLCFRLNCSLHFCFQFLHCSCLQYCLHALLRASSCSIVWTFHRRSYPTTFYLGLHRSCYHWLTLLSNGTQRCWGYHFPRYLNCDWPYLAEGSLCFEQYYVQLLFLHAFAFKAYHGTTSKQVGRAWPIENLQLRPFWRWTIPIFVKLEALLFSFWGHYTLTDCFSHSLNEDCSRRLYHSYCNWYSVHRSCQWWHRFCKHLFD